MGNSKNKPFSTSNPISTGSNNVSLPSSATSVGLVHLGRLRSVDFRLGTVILRSATSYNSQVSSSQHSASSRGTLTPSPTSHQSLLFLDALTSPTSFILYRSSSRPHKGLGGFTGSIRFDGGLYSISQDGPFLPPSKPSLPFRKRRRLSSLSTGDDPPLDIFDSSSAQQVLGLLLKKSESQTASSSSASSSSLTNKSGGEVVAADVFTIGGLVGSACLRPGKDWSDLMEVRNVEGSLLFTAQRFNRLSGGFEYQIYSSLGGNSDQEEPIDDESSSTGGAIIAATLVRLEESKFILRIYVPCPAVVKGLLLGLATLLMYLLAR